MLFRLKNLVLAPRAAIRRRRYRGTDPIGVSLMEHFRYTDPIFSHFAAIVERPDLLIDFPLDDASVVWDVGGHVGEWCAPMAQRYGCRVEVFEPSPVALETLERVAAEHERVRLHPFGVAAVDTTMQIAHKGPGSSLYDTSDEWDKATVEVRDVVSVLDELGDDRIDLIKMNIEGGEYDVLERLLAAGRLVDGEHYVIQYHEWLPKAYWRRWRIRRGMRRTHRLVWDYPFVWEYWVRR
ncbi:MAG: FkbM family methyltransferase [Actinomycetota bacterium]